MLSASPLTKNCPRCRAILTAQTAHCACGYHFESDVTRERPSSDLVAQAEALYEMHLRARLRRAIRTARFAKIDVLRDPRNPLKTAQLRAAEKEVSLLETQVTIQSARAAEARAVTTARPAQSAFAPSIAVSVEAPESFHAAQTIKVEQASELLRLQLALEKLHSTQTTGVFTAVQADKAREVQQRAGAARTCSGCGNVVTAGTELCGCGYNLPATGTNAGSDFLTAEEFAALRNVT